MSDAARVDQRMPRLDGLTGLRWWAAFVVFGFHMGVLAPLPWPISAVFAQGYYGVTFFFVLSGFVLTWSLTSRVSQSTFYWRRFARIYPLHLVTLLLAIPVFYNLGFGHDAPWVRQPELGILSLSLVLLQGWFLAPAVLFSGNPAAWTLSCEAFFYALHPYISRFLSPRAIRGALLTAAAFIVLMFVVRSLAVVLPASFFALMPLPLLRLPEFVLGMAIAWAVRCGWRPWLPVWLGLGSLALTIGTIIVLPVLLVGQPALVVIMAFSNEIVAVACALTVLSVAVRTMNGRSTIFASRVHVRLGEWSFAFYLIHATLIYTVLAIVGYQEPSWRNLGWFAALLAASLVASATLHHGVEKPIERAMRRWKDERDLRRSAAAVDPVLPQR